MADKTKLPVIPDPRRDDLNHLDRVNKSRLNLFMDGNQSMVMQERSVDVGPVWVTEAVYARSQKLSVEVIETGPDLDQRHRVGYYISQLKQSPNPENAKRFLHFMGSDRVRDIYTKHGFFHHDE